MLDIYLLGTPRIFLNGEQISVRRKKTRALLFYLAMHPQGVERGILADIFGGDGDDVKKRGTLRRYLNFIRGIDKNNDFVVNYHDTLCLDPRFVTVDAITLLDAAETVKRNKSNYEDQGRTLPLELYQQVDAFVQQLEGTEFILSNELDRNIELGYWKNEQDVRLKEAQGVLFTFLAEMSTHFGRSSLALIWAERALQVDLLEDAYYFQLRAWRDMGEFEKARSAFQELQESFGSEMSQRLADLGADLIDMGEANPLYARPVWALRPSVSLPFVGQVDILERMKVNYQRGIGSLLVGEAGIGKTRLVKQLYEKLSLKPNLLLVPCYKDNENLPYQPWIDMLRYSFTEEFWQTTPAWWTNPLTMLLPELHDYRNDLDASPGDVFTSTLVFEAFKNLLDHANKQSAALLFVEDAQWMDRVSFSLLKYLIIQATFKKWNIGLVVTSRFGMHTGVENFEFDAMQGKLDEINIAPITQAEMKEFSFSILGEILSDKKAARLEKMTGGNPFFLLELINYQASHKDVDIFEDFSTTPPSVRQLIAARLEVLSPQARQVLNYAAIQGNHFSLSILEETLQLSLEKMHAIISELTRMHLIGFLEKDIDLNYAFLHEKLREEVVNTLSPVDLRLMHANIAKVLAPKRLYQDEQAAVLADHHENAGDFEKAFFAWHAAAKHAYNIFSHIDSQAAFLRAEKLLSRITLDDDAIYDFYLSWNVMLFNNDDPDTLEIVMQGLLTFAQRHGSSLLIGAALDGLSDVCMARNQFKEGLGYTEEALAYLIMSANIPAQMMAFIHQGVFLYMLKNFPASLTSFQTVLSLDNGQKDPVSMYAIGNAHYQMAVGLTGMGYPIHAIEEAQKSIYALRLSFSPQSIISPHSIIGLANYYLGEYSLGKKHALTSLELAQRTGTWRMVGYASAYAGMNETELPEIGNAWHHAEEAINYGKKYKHTEIIAMGYKIIGDIYTRLESPLAALGAYQHGLDMDKDSFVTAENSVRLGAALGLVGDPKADVMLEKAITNARTAGLEIIEMNARALQLSLFVAYNEYEAFDKKLPAIRDILTERSHPKSFVWTDYLQAQRLKQEKKHEEALILLEETLPVLEQIEFFWIHLRAQRLYLSLLQKLKRDTTQTQAKINTMLTAIENGLGDAPLANEWKIFSKRVKKEMA
jgi:tetratricopeptide (TPR) repeat protein